MGDASVERCIDTGGNGGGFGPASLTHDAVSGKVIDVRRLDLPAGNDAVLGAVRVLP